ncbi:Lacal_2735 family protein [Algoriphagus sp. H41]|uniref:Lacal_2735 family protein n=1 Tax=Algoriphagus oliviformis TaxID=2811231 RepID=A0ABS3C5J9_9BACT|nr:Lacal_2735 family protein [Algoriphagus oliviformis]
MFSFFKKDPLKNLETKRRKLLEEAMQIQRSGDCSKKRCKSSGRATSGSMLPKWK